MREYEKAIEAIQEAAEHDDDGKSSDEIQKQMSRCSQALMSQRASESEEDTLNRAMRDPEVAVGVYAWATPSFWVTDGRIQSIMNDPVMQQILQQAQQNPGALQDHMKNPIVKNKILKLVNAGIIKTRWRLFWCFFYYPAVFYIVQHVSFCFFVTMWLSFPVTSGASLT